MTDILRKVFPTLPALSVLGMMVALYLTVYASPILAQEAYNIHNEGVVAYQKGDYKKAVSLFREAADHGLLDAQVLLGDLYRSGTVITQDLVEAAMWYRSAADRGSADGQFKLGHLYYEGLGVRQAYIEALRWYKKAADQGHEDAQYNLAVMYYNGDGVDQNYREAARWFKSVAENRYNRNLPQFILAEMYYAGKGVERDYAMAAAWFYQATRDNYDEREEAKNSLKTLANEGSAHAQFEVAKMVYREQSSMDEQREGSGVDNSESERLYKAAAEQGHMEAQTALGSLYYKQGKHREAARWHRMAAEQGSEKSQQVLGMSYYLGRGVTKNEAEARRWMRRAVRQGSSEAKVTLRSWDRDIYFNGNHPSWKYIASSNNGSKLYINTASIGYDHDHRYPYVVGKFVFDRPQELSGNKSYDTELFDAFVNCSERKMMDLSNKLMLQGQVVPQYHLMRQVDVRVKNSYVEYGTWNTIAPGTLGESIRKAACN